MDLMTFEKDKKSRGLDIDEEATNNSGCCFGCFGGSKKK
jgi:hypothetical protein